MSIPPTSSSPTVPVTPTGPGKSKDVPPGLAKRDMALPPGIAKKLENGGSLPAGIGKRFPTPQTEAPVPVPAATPTSDTAPTVTTEPVPGEQVDLRV